MPLSLKRSTVIAAKGSRRSLLSMSMFTREAKRSWARLRQEEELSRKLIVNQSKLSMHLGPRCGAKTRREKPCQSPAMKNGRCRMHGGSSTGAPKGNRNAFKHGRYSAHAIAERRRFSELIRE